MATHTFEVRAVLVLLGLALSVCVANGTALQHRRVLLEKYDEKSSSSYQFNASYKKSNNGDDDDNNAPSDKKSNSKKSSSDGDDDDDDNNAAAGNSKNNKSEKSNKGDKKNKNNSDDENNKNGKKSKKQKNGSGEESSGSGEASSGSGKKSKKQKNNDNEINSSGGKKSKSKKEKSVEGDEPSGAPAGDEPSGAPEKGSSGDEPSGAPEEGSSGGVPSGAPKASSSAPIPVPKGGGTVFDITKNGAKGDGKTSSTQAFMTTWKAACSSSSPATVLVPSGNFVTGPVVFQGPCKAKSITFELQGTITATTDLSDYSSPEWLSFEKIDGLIIMGKGTFDGQGASAWKYNTGEDGNLPDNLRFFQVNGGDISEITSLNSKSFHLHVVECKSMNFHNVKFTAPGDSPNTDGIHISKSSDVKVLDAVIATGDDCISVGQGTTNLEISRVTCGPGHGISVGSLGKYKDEADVSGIKVTNCTLKKTTNGARIKSYTDSGASKATDIVYQDIIMVDVANPIIIDQHYGKKGGSPSKVQLSNIHFRNIKGTTSSKVGLKLDCSTSAPCTGVELANIALTSSAGGKLSSACDNAKVTTVGQVNLQCEDA